jgi:hypothetical protein
MNIFQGSERFFVLCFWIINALVFTGIGFVIGYFVFK